MSKKFPVNFLLPRNLLVSKRTVSLPRDGGNQTTVPLANYAIDVGEWIEWANNNGILNLSSSNEIDTIVLDNVDNNPDQLTLTINFTDGSSISSNTITTIDNQAAADVSIDAIEDLTATDVQEALEEIYNTASCGKRVYPDSESVALQTNGDDITLTRSTGSCTITVPDGIDLKSFQMSIDNSDQGSNSSYTIDVEYQGTRSFNQNSDLSDAIVPNIQMSFFNASNKITSTSQDDYEVTIPSAGTLRIIFLNALMSPIDKRRIKLQFE